LWSTPREGFGHPQLAARRCSSAHICATTRSDYHSAALAAVGQSAALPKGGAGGGSQPLEDISMASPIHPQLCNLMAVESTARNLWLLRRRSGGLGLTTVADPQIIGRGEVPVYPVESRITLPLWLVAHSRSSRLLLQVWGEFLGSQQRERELYLTGGGAEEQRGGVFSQARLRAPGWLRTVAALGCCCRSPIFV
jgi:hypothetical protein